MKRSPLVPVFAVFLICLGMGLWLGDAGCAVPSSGMCESSKAFFIATGIAIAIFLVALVWELERRWNK